VKLSERVIGFIFLPIPTVTFAEENKFDPKFERNRNTATVEGGPISGDRGVYDFTMSPVC